MTVPRLLALAAALSVATLATAAEQRFEGLIEGQSGFADGEPSWLDAGLGKLRDEDGSGALRLAFEHELQLTDLLSTHLVAEGYADAEGTLGITEYWLGYAPVPQSAWRQRWRLGAFIPPISLENGGVAWSAERTLTPSLLNSWIGEELRATGLEYELRWLGAQAGSAHDLSVRGALFMHNDTAGTILSWRGWAANDRVTPLNHTLPLPVRAAFLPGGPYAGKTLLTDPFLEIDGRPGYYLGGEWRHLDGVRLRLSRYDNRADPMRFAEGQIGWLTRFDALGAQWQVAEGTELIAQWLRGDTLAGSASSPYGVYNEYDAWFVLLSRDTRFGRVSVRYERFAVRDEDVNLIDDNREDGDAVTLAWLRKFDLRKFGNSVEVGVEALALESSRPERAAVGQPVAANERQLRLMVRYGF